MKPGYWTIRRTALLGAILGAAFGMVRAGGDLSAYALGGVTVDVMLGAIIGAIVLDTCLLKNQTEGATIKRAHYPTSLQLQRYAFAVLSHLGLVVAWYLFVKLGEVPKFVMPSPYDTIHALLVPNYRWLENIAVTSTEIFGGYILAVAFGIGTALLFSWFRWLDMAIMPLLISLNMIPKVALGPLIIVWFKYGIGPNALMAFAICFFPIVLTTARGLREVEPDLLDLVRALRGSRWQIFTKIQLPGALPYIFSGMKVAAILAVAGAVVGEFLGSDRGLGYLMLQVQVTLDTAAMFMAVILITLIGVRPLRSGAGARAGAGGERRATFVRPWPNRSSASPACRRSTVRGGRICPRSPR